MKNLATLILLPFVIGACSSAPAIPIAPTVEVASFEPLVITPDAIRYRAEVVINNQMQRRLDVVKVDWEADLHGKPIASDSFDPLISVRARGQQTVALPFQIAMKDVVNQAVEVLAEEGVRVDFRGAVHPVEFDPVPFETSRTIPLPKIPVVSIQGVDGVPLQGKFQVILGIKNNNAFPMTFQSVDSYLGFHGKRYTLLKSRNDAEIGPGSTGTVTLTMRRTGGRSLSLTLNMIQPEGETKFEIGGSFSCHTPHGLFEVPLKLNSD